MGHLRRRIILPLIIILLGILFLISRLGIKRVIRERGGADSPITVDTIKREISFTGYIEKDTGWVQHLIYLQGYKWLKERSAIVSPVRLKDWQLTFAGLDFYLWDSLWQGKGASSRVKLFICDIPAESLVTTDEELVIGDFLFLGSPYFDHLALEGNHHLCEKCPVYEIERKTLEELFIRPSGKSGYYLNTKNFPKEKEVKIVIRLDER